MKIKHVAAVLGTLTLTGGLVLTTGTGTALAGVDPPGIYVHDASFVIEMDSGDPAPLLTFNVEGVGIITGPCELVVQTLDITATGGADYLAFSQNITIPSGDSTTPIKVTTTPDDIFEPDANVGLPDIESLKLVALPGQGLVNPPCGTIGEAPIQDPEGVGDIQDDDPPGGLELRMDDDRSICESALPDGTVLARLNLNRPLADDETLEFDLETSNGTASAPSDYTTTTQHYTIDGATDTNQTFEDLIIPIVDDFAPELNDFFWVLLKNVVYTGPNSEVALDDQQIIIIKNDDVIGQEITVHDAQSEEGNVPADDRYLNFIFESKFPAICDGLKLHFFTTPGTAQEDPNGPPPGAGDDYFRREGYVTILPGNTTEDKRVFIREDTNIEDDETLTVTVDEPLGVVGSTDPNDPDGGLIGTGTIINDDFPDVNISDAAIVEGTGGTNYLVFNVTLDPTTTPHSFASVNWYTQDGTATGGNCFGVDDVTDYCAGSSTLNFDTNETQHQIYIPVIGDGRPENNEDMYVYLWGASDLIIDDGEGYGLIWNDDHWVVNGIDIPVAEGTPPGQSNHQLLITLRLNAPRPNSSLNTALGANNLGAHWQTSDITATGGPTGVPPEDYITASGNVLFDGPSATDETVEITIVVDETIELNETLQLLLTANGNSAFYNEADCSDGGCFILDMGQNPIITIVNDDEELPGTGGLDYLPEMTMTGFAMAMAGLVLVLAGRRRRTVN